MSIDTQETAVLTTTQESPPKKLYPAPKLEDVRQQIRKLGVEDPDRLLSPLQCDIEFANHS